MSIEVEVFPTQSPGLTISQVEKCMRDLSSCRPSLGISVDDELLATNIENTTSIERGKLYFVPFGCRSLTLAVWDSEENELDHFCAHVRNIPIDYLTNLAERNAKVGVYFNLDSKMGRGRHETSMLLLLAASLAKLSDGLVIIPDHPVENIPQGGYRWHEIMEKFKFYNGEPIEPIVTRDLQK